MDDHGHDHGRHWVTKRRVYNNGNRRRGPNCSKVQTNGRTRVPVRSDVSHTALVNVSHQKISGFLRISTHTSFRDVFFRPSVVFRNIIFNSRFHIVDGNRRACSDDARARFDRNNYEGH